MKTGLKKSENTTEIYFNEASPVIEIRTYNTDLKNRLTEYAERFPVLRKLIDEDAEQGYKEFIIRKGRFCFRLTAPYSEEWRDKARQLAMESNASDRLK